MDDDDVVAVLAKLKPDQVDETLHKNIRFAIIRVDDLRRSHEEGAPLSLNNHHWNVVVASFAYNDTKLYRGSVMELKPTATFVKEGTPLEFIARVHMPWCADGNPSKDDMGTILVMRPWHKFVRPLSFDDFAALWAAASTHPALPSGEFVY